MPDISANNKRIAKNTLMLYFRLLFLMVVTLYTSRVILSTLGVEDFGIYNVVGGVVAMFGFLNTSMATSTQRYLNFELGRNNFSQLQKVFCTSLSIHTLISIIIFILAETIGLWFLYNKMTIPETRMDAALWVYQFAILSTIVLVMSVPYNAAIIAHERMSAFAYISILEVTLRLLIVFVLQLGSYDRLKLYAILMFLVQLCIRFVYGSYCTRHFKETRFRWKWDKSLFKEMLSFAGWNLWGNCAWIAYTQGINILLNVFFGPIVNAARGVAVQVQNAITQFYANFQMAINPQITKSYATNDYAYMHSLIFRSSKFTFFLMLLLCLPVILETEMILRIWLKTVPDYTVVFLRLMLCITIIDAIVNPIMISAQATGKVRFYQSVVGGILLSIVPIAYIVLKLGGRPMSVFIVHLCICIVAFIVRLLIVRPMINLSLTQYFRKVIIRCIKVTILAVMLPVLLYIIMPNTIMSFLCVCVVCVFSVSVISYMIGLDNSERIVIRAKIVSVVSKIKR
ncbi:MAG: lipopolysaccharide biosynthesis protein [Prevotella sp.]|nr:lipopolysaccharide biosynthesis protein [Prevotella sp.]